MLCYKCEYDGGCQLQEIAPDITGCSGHSKYKEQPFIDKSTKEPEANPKQQKRRQLSDFEIGDIVKADSNPYNLRTDKLPGYLAGQPLKVIGFTKSKVKCDWDGGKAFHISPELLRKAEG